MSAPNPPRGSQVQTFGRRDIGLLLGVSDNNNEALPTTASSLPFVGLATATAFSGSAATKGHGAQPDLSSLDAAQAAELVKSRHGRGKRDGSRFIKRHRADPGDGVTASTGGKRKKVLQYKVLAGIMERERQDQSQPHPPDQSSGDAGSFDPDVGVSDEEDDGDDGFVQRRRAESGRRKRAEPQIVVRRGVAAPESRRSERSDSSGSGSESSSYGRSGRRRGVRRDRSRSSSSSSEPRKGRHRRGQRGRRQGRRSSPSASSSSSSETEGKREERRRKMRKRRENETARSSPSDDDDDDDDDEDERRMRLREKALRRRREEEEGKECRGNVKSRTTIESGREISTKEVSRKVGVRCRERTSVRTEGDECYQNGRKVHTLLEVQRRDRRGSSPSTSSSNSDSSESESSESESGSNSESESESESDAVVVAPVSKPLFVPKNRRKTALEEEAKAKEEEEAEARRKAHKEKEKMKSRAMVAQAAAAEALENQTTDLGLSDDGEGDEFNETGGCSMPPPDDNDDGLTVREEESRRDAWEVRELLRCAPPFNKEHHLVSFALQNHGLESQLFPFPFSCPFGCHSLHPFLYVTSFPFVSPRVLRDHDALAAVERERLELKRRRAMTDEERLAEDMVSGRYRRPGESRCRPKKDGEDHYLQRYYHRGAFYMDEDTLREAGKDDVRHKVEEYARAATGEDKFNKRALPEVMQVKKFGFSGSTKYKGLAKEDTTDYKSAYLPSTSSRVGEGRGRGRRERN